jgi:hypothetical protein
MGFIRHDSLKIKMVEPYEPEDHEKLKREMNGVEALHITFASVAFDRPGDVNHEMFHRIMMLVLTTSSPALTSVIIRVERQTGTFDWNPYWDVVKQTRPPMLKSLTLDLVQQKSRAIDWWTVFKETKSLIALLDGALVLGMVSVHQWMGRSVRPDASTHACMDAGCALFPQGQDSNGARVRGRRYNGLGCPASAAA